MNALAASMAGFFTTFWTTAKTANAGDTDYRKANTYYYPAGSLVPVASGEGIPGTVVTGNATAYQPATTALVCSLKSDTAGRRGRGRFYLPATAVSLQANHQVLAATIVTLSTALKTMLDAINGTETSGTPVGNNRVAVASHAAGHAYPVTSASVDSKPDVQRRRKNKLTPQSESGNVILE